MIYYIPYNWKVENNTKIPTSLLVSATIFGTVLKQTATATITTVEEKAAACFMLIMPTNLLEQQRNKFGKEPQSES